MPEGIVNKNTILVFSTYENMRNYVPSGINRIGIDNSTGNYYIYSNIGTGNTGARWILFRETIPEKKADWWPLTYLSPIISAESHSVTWSQTGSQQLFINAYVNAGNGSNIGNYYKMYNIPTAIFTGVTCSTSPNYRIYGAEGYELIPYNQTGSIILTVSTSLA